MADARHAHRHVVREELPHAVRARGFAAEVELQLQVLLQLVEQRQEVHGVRVETLVVRRHAPRRREVVPDDVVDVRILHLHGDFLATDQPRAVHLRKRRRGDRLLGEELEYFVDSGRPKSSSTTRRTVGKSRGGRRS